MTDTTTDTMRCAASVWLDGVRRAAASVDSIKREVDALICACDECGTWRTGGSGTGSAHGAHSDPTAAAAESRMVELEALIAERRAAYARAVSQVGAAGEVLDAMRETMPRHAEALELYYIDLADTWGEVADEMGVTDRWARALRRGAYAWIERRFPHVLA